MLNDSIKTNVIVEQTAGIDKILGDWNLVFRQKHNYRAMV